MKFAYYLCRFILALILKLILRIRLEVSGREYIPKTGPFILISNHLSFLDPSIVGVACPRWIAFLARQDLFDNFFLGTLMKSIGVISIRRDSADLGAIKKALKILKSGNALAVFPEGSRQNNPQDSFQNIKKGFLLLARRAGVPIVAAKIYGSEKCLGKSENRIRRGIQIRVNFSKPFAIGRNEDYDVALKRFEQVLVDL